MSAAEKRVDALNAFPVFRELSDSQCEILIGSGQIREAEFTDAEITGECVYCIRSGNAAVYSMDGERPLLLRCLGAGDIFGVATLYATRRKISRITAKGRVRMLAVPPDVIDGLLHSHDAFRHAYLAFLSDRIAFLNQRIACVTAGSAQRKLASWLLGLSDADEFTLPVRMGDLPGMLDLGRASVYRAFDLLTDRGCIRRTGNRIQILDRQAMQREH